MRLPQDLMPGHAPLDFDLGAIVPFVVPASDSESRLELDMIQNIIQPLFPKTQIQDVRTFEGHVHPVYILKLSNDLEVILKTAPRQLTALLRQERHTLETEAKVLALLRSNGSTANSWIPHLVRFDTLNFSPCTSYLLRHSLRGMPLGEIESALTYGDRKNI